MYREEGCGCGGHGHHHGEQASEERQEGRNEDCGCGGHEHHGQHEQGMNREGGHGACNCGCHQHHGVMGFHRRFVSREEVITRLEEYLKQLQAEAKGVEERIAEMKKGKESQ
jgi:hypothetical protein